MEMWHVEDVAAAQQGDEARKDLIAGWGLWWEPVSQWPPPG